MGATASMGSSNYKSYENSKDTTGAVSNATKFCTGFLVILFIIVVILFGTVAFYVHANNKLEEEIEKLNEEKLKEENNKDEIIENPENPETFVSKKHPFLKEFKDKIDKFTNGKLYTMYKKYFRETKDHPMVFDKQLNSYPENCTAYAGCFYPSFLSNPVSLKTGERYKNPEDKNPDDKVWCEKSWRDCGAYQDCVNGQCAPKKSLRN